MVNASCCVASSILFAARPVGAASFTESRPLENSSRTALTSVVFPTPGPPVITSTPELAACSTAARCAEASTVEVRCSNASIACAAPLSCLTFLLHSAASHSASCTSAWCNLAAYTTGP